MLFDESFLRLLDRLELLLRVSRNTSLSGEKMSREDGIGLDFNDYRQYEIGDDYRYIDWNLYSRLGQLFLKEFAAERGVNIHFLIDKSQSMLYDNGRKYDLGRKLAGALGYIALSRFDQVEALFFGDRPAESSGKLYGKYKLKFLFDILENTAGGGKTDIKRIINYLLRRNKKAGLAVVISDFLDESGFFPALKLLKSRGWRVLLLHIDDKEEFFKVKGQYILKDIETSEKRDMVVDEEALNYYKEAENEFFNELSNFARKYRLNYYNIDVDRSLEDILLGVLKNKVY
ncbi:MAG: DUF58 domain-containing protein [Bacillota bacterium]